MELQSALENRKSIRSYLSKDVEPEKLTALIEAASLAPSWKNSQTARYYVYQTLRIFTKCGFNKAHTSERLFLHRNTVNYRIAQIESICGIDLSTTELLFSLQLSFLIDGYLNNVAF